MSRKNKKIVVGISMIILIILAYLFFWKSTFSLASENDKLFFIGYGCVLVVTLVMFFEIKKNVICYIIAGLACIATIVSLFLYRDWNRSGFYIDMNDVESIVYYSEDGEIVYTEILDNIISKYNTAECVKNMEGQGEPGTPTEYMKVYFFDGTDATIVNKYIWFDDNRFIFNYTIEDLLKK